jgi:hypothetical protein
VLKNSSQRNLLQNFGTLFLQFGPNEIVFAQAGLRGKKFSEFDRPRLDTEFFNTIGSFDTFAAQIANGWFRMDRPSLRRA